jgi:hypothetical protein
VTFNAKQQKAIKRCTADPIQSAHWPLGSSPQGINLRLLNWGNRAPSGHTAVCQWSRADEVRILIQSRTPNNRVRVAIRSIPYGPHLWAACHPQ